VLGNDAPLYAKRGPKSIRLRLRVKTILPVPVRLRAFEADIKRFYGQRKSLQIWTGRQEGSAITREYVTPDRIVAADLGDWEKYRTPAAKVAVDPRLGRILFRPASAWRACGFVLLRLQRRYGRR